jgi:hypothetical protein
MTDDIMQNIRLLGFINEAMDIVQFRGSTSRF